MDKEEYRLLVFNSTHHALEMEELLKENDYNTIVVPVPPEISANCGIAIKLPVDAGDVLALAKDSEIKIGGYYQIQEQGLEKKIKRV